MSTDYPLAQPEPQGPSDEVWDALKQRLWHQYETRGYQGERWIYDDDFDTALDVVRQELARFGRPAIEPVPVAERLPGPENLDHEGTCWMFHPVNFHYCLCRPDPSVHTHWLPHYALPVPQQQEVE
jgi:hypothetical protein